MAIGHYLSLLAIDHYLSLLAIDHYLSLFAIVCCYSLLPKTGGLIPSGFVFPSSFPFPLCTLSFVHCPLYLVHYFVLPISPSFRPLDPHCMRSKNFRPLCRLGDGYKSPFLTFVPFRRIPSAVHPLRQLARHRMPVLCSLPPSPLPSLPPPSLYPPSWRIMLACLSSSVSAKLADLCTPKR